MTIRWFPALYTDSIGERVAIDEKAKSNYHRLAKYLQRIGKYCASAHEITSQTKKKDKKMHGKCSPIWK